MRRRRFKVGRGEKKDVQRAEAYIRDHEERLIACPCLSFWVRLPLLCVTLLLSGLSVLAFVSLA